MPSACKLSQLFGNTSSGRASSAARERVHAHAGSRECHGERVELARRTGRHFDAAAGVALEVIRARRLGIGREVRGADHQYGVRGLRFARSRGVVIGQA